MGINQSGFMGITHRTIEYVYSIIGYEVIVADVEGSVIFRGEIIDLPKEHLNTLLDANLIKYVS